MILLFDLDRTLIDTEKFTKDKSSVFGLTPEENEIHAGLLFKRGERNYNPEAHLQFLIKSGHIKTKEQENSVREKYQKLIKQIDNYLFPETEKTLAYLKKQGHRLILITFGDLSIQKPKVDNSAIKKYFEKIIYEPKDKSENKELKKLAKLKEDILIINDKAGESLKMQKVLGKRAKIFLVDGKHSKDAPHTEKIYKNITELKDII